MDQRELHLRDYLRVVAKRKYTVFTVLVLVLGGAVLYTLSAVPLYRGDVKVLIEKVEPSSLYGGYRWSAHDPEFYETQYQLIKSHAVARRVVATLALETSELFLPAEGAGAAGPAERVSAWLSETWAVARRVLGFAPLAPEPPAGESALPRTPERQPLDEIAEQVRRGLEVRPVRDSRIAEVSYLSPHPRLAAAIANAAANAYIEQTLEMRLSSARQALGWMAKKAEEERSRLERSEKALQQYMRANDIVTMEDRIAVTPQRLADLSAQLTRAEARRKELQVLHAKVEELSAEPGLLETLPAVASDPSLGALRAEILKAEQRISELSRRYGPKHPLMVKALEELEVLRDRRGLEVRRIVSSLRNEYELAVANEREFRGVLEETKARASGLNEKYIQYGILKREADANRQLYEALTKKLKEQSVTEDTQSVNLWIVEEAKVPEAPVYPRTRRNVLLGAVLGLLAGLGMAFLVEYLDNTVKGPDDVETTLGLPLLGVVSNLRGRRARVEEVLLDGKLTPVAEEYRSLRTALLLSSAQGPPRSVVVTSMTPEEGKTSTALNLAVALAQSGRPVVLVDADLRRPRIHKALGLGNEVGLSTYLTGASGPEVLQQTAVPQLRVVPAGPLPPNPQELLSSRAMAELARTLAPNGEVVIFDSPPVLTVADARLLAKLADGTILVARSKKVTCDELRAGVKLLRDIDARVLGVVLNRFDARRGGYGYYHRYGYGYGGEA